MGIPHYMVVEDQEYDAYAAVVDDSATLLVLDKTYQDSYDTCDDLGATKSKGPGAARNFAWAHSMTNDASWHWVMDDNIRGFYRLNNNKIVPVTDGAIFVAMETFANRYSNLGMCGPNYFLFTIRKMKRSPYVLNTRIYSCNLIRNDLPYRWRGRYNEDTDISLRMLKAGWCTVQFTAFVQDKLMTQSVKGGNTKEFYDSEGTLPKSRMQVMLHPDVSRLTWRYGRWHHQVDYSKFKYNSLKRKPGVILDADPDEFGMVYQIKGEEGWLRG